MSQLFLSYSREDSEIATRLYSDLINRHRIRAWMDTAEIRGGDSWRNLIVEAISQSSHFVVLLSRKATKRCFGFIQREIHMALRLVDADPVGGLKIVPCRLDVCSPRQPRLRELHQIDLFPSYDIGFTTLEKALEIRPEQFVESSDSIELLRSYRALFDRPAFTYPCIFEGAIAAVVKAVNDISAAIATGRYYSRDGNLLASIKPISAIADTHMREELLSCARLLPGISRAADALREQIVKISSDLGCEREVRAIRYMEMVIDAIIAAQCRPSQLAALVASMDAVDNARNDFIAKANRLFIAHSVSRISPIRTSSVQIRLSQSIETCYRYARAHRYLNPYNLFYVRNWDAITALLAKSA